MNTALHDVNWPASVIQHLLKNECFFSFLFKKCFEITFSINKILNCFEIILLILKLLTTLKLEQTLNLKNPITSLQTPYELYLNVGQIVFATVWMNSSLQWMHYATLETHAYDGISKMYISSSL